VEPIRAIPKIAKDDPKRLQDLKDSAAPSVTISKTESAAPTRPRPNNEKDEPILAKLLSDNEAPR
jgi:hypothetical protein